MGELQRRHFKENLPEETVNRLKNILKDNNISVEERVFKRSEINTYSCRITFENTNIGANGKGMTKEYALASGYAELFERYQNAFLCADLIGKTEEFPFYYSPDEKFISFEQLIDEKNIFIEMLISKLGLQKVSKKKQIRTLSELNYLDETYEKKENQVLCIPYYSVKEDKEVYIPLNFSRFSYGSNGMCAGNKPEEAIVQGLSEIFERVAQKKIFKECPVLPSISKEYIKKEYPALKESIELLEKQKDIYFEFKDGSFGGNYPVACLLVVEKNTGKYGFKLGCHPVYEIALERTLTEATQGQQIKDYANQNDLKFDYIFEEDELYNSYKIGKGNYPYQILNEGKESEQFRNDKKNSTNKEILIEWVERIISQGYDVLIRDCSIFGFPSFQIIIPDFSELVFLSKERIHAINSRYYCMRLITSGLNPLNEENVNICLATMNYFFNSILDNSLKNYYAVIDDKDIPYEKYGLGMLYFMTMCHLYLKEHKEALYKINTLIKALKAVKEVEKEDLGFLICLKFTLLLSFEKDIEKKEEGEKILNNFFTKELRQKAKNLLTNKEDIFKSQYININDKNSFDINKYKKLEGSLLRFLTPYKKALKESSINQHVLRRIFIKEKSNG